MIINGTQLFRFRTFLNAFNSNFYELIITLLNFYSEYKKFYKNNSSNQSLWKKKFTSKKKMRQ